MCTILFSWKNTDKYRLILLANRDEFYQRETKRAHWWEDHPDILGGIDLQAGGTWMGINKNGRFAAITNYRKFPLEAYETSRGDLVKEFLIHDDSPDDYMNQLMEKGMNYDGFNLIFGNPDNLYYFSNRGPEFALNPGDYGLSNHLLDTPWPKVSRGKEMMTKILEKGEPNKNELFKILQSQERAEDELLPNTGIGLEKERLLSSIFIESPEYGTRLSTYLTIDESGRVEFHEKSYVPNGEASFEFRID